MTVMRKLKTWECERHDDGNANELLTGMWKTSRRECERYFGGNVKEVLTVMRKVGNAKDMV